jgi:HSP20 family protein
MKKMTENQNPTPPREIVATVVTSPFDELDGLFDRLHGELLPVFGPSFRWAPVASGGSGPTDVEDTGAAYEIRVDLPGVAREEIQVDVQGRELHLKAEHRTESTEKKDRKFLRQERAFQSYERSFELPEPLDSDRVTAKFENGVLLVTVPKAHPASARKVEVA